MAVREHCIMRNFLLVGLVVHLHENSNSNVVAETVSGVAAERTTVTVPVSKGPEKKNETRGIFETRKMRWMK